MASNRGAAGRKGRTMQGSEKAAKRPTNEARTLRNKAREQKRHEARIQARRDKLRDGLTVEKFNASFRAITDRAYRERRANYGRPV